MNETRMCSQRGKPHILSDDVPTAVVYLYLEESVRYFLSFLFLSLRLSAQLESRLGFVLMNSAGARPHQQRRSQKKKQITVGRGNRNSRDFHIWTRPRFTSRCLLCPFPQAHRSAGGEREERKKKTQRIRVEKENHSHELGIKRGFLRAQRPSS